MGETNEKRTISRTDLENIKGSYSKGGGITFVREGGGGGQTGQKKQLGQEPKYAGSNNNPPHPPPPPPANSQPSQPPPPPPTLDTGWSKPTGARKKGALETDMEWTMRTLRDIEKGGLKRIRLRIRGGE